MNYPFRVGIDHNQEMKCHELLIQVGGLESEQKAIEIAKRIQDLLGGKTKVKKTRAK